MVVISTRFDLRIVCFCLRCRILPLLRTLLFAMRVLIVHHS